MVGMHVEELLAPIFSLASFEELQGILASTLQKSNPSYPELQVIPSVVNQTK
jgi:hypothetical protein